MSVNPKKAKVNTLGLARTSYTGKPSTLCPGCGHNSISNQIIAACFELGLPPHRLAKFSGIGCSSKTPAYFLGHSSGFNSVHGRMPSLATGALLANRDLIAVGVSGDGDTASIGLGQFKHMVRRNIPLVYIVENNGVYGLTKGQFSATADQDQTLKYAGHNELPPVDICMEALVAGCGFVARSFSGDARQVQTLLKAAFSYRGAAVLDIISPCVTFNNDPAASKSYPYGKAYEAPLHELTFVPEAEEITVDYEPGAIQDVQLHDGSVIRLRKLAEDYDPTDRSLAIETLERARAEEQFITGLIYINQERPDFVEVNHLIPEPLAGLPPEKLRPSRQALAEVMAGF
ncbi:MAG: 2-oxoacid:ferredoxin oxidoreductase subunit beta [Anaerolineae bacterium]